MLGFDTVYSNTYKTADLISIAEKQNRILLSRNSAISKNIEIRSLVILSEMPFEQLKQVMENFHLFSQVAPFTRCLICNGLLETVAKEAVQGNLMQNTHDYYNDFWQCKNCQRIYWKGSHYERMTTLLNSIDQGHD